MAVLFDPADEYVRSVLDRAKIDGEISLADLESIVEAGIEAKGGSIPTDDIGDTIDALASMGIEIETGSRRRRRTPSSSGRCGSGQAIAAGLTSLSAVTLWRAWRAPSSARGPPGVLPATRRRPPRKRPQCARSCQKELGSKTCSPTSGLGSGASAEVRERARRSHSPATIHRSRFPLSS
jgi:hypothetical protein